MRDSPCDKLIGDQECHEIVRKKLREYSIDDFRLIDYEVIPIVEVNGFMGQYFTLKTTVSCTKTPSENRVYNFFTKIPPPSTSPQFEWIQEYNSFKKEVELYTMVFPEVLRGLEKRSIPECFLGHGNDVIVLEDMAHSGFTMTDKFVPFDFEHCRVIVRSLAKFHAKSIVFEEIEEKNLYDEFAHCMQETLWPLSEGRSNRMLKAAIKGVLSMIDLLDDLDERQRDTLKKRFEDRASNHAEKLRPSVKHRNVLCHGDLWANNILIRYDESKKPEACCLIDFQLARYNPPAHDILCFLQFTTTSDLRKNHADELFKIYWNCMIASLTDAGLDASTIFPWSEFLDSINELRTMCEIHGILNIPIMLLEPTAASKYFSEEPELLESVLYDDRTPLICGQFHRVPQYRMRMTDALLELRESTLLP